MRPVSTPSRRREVTAGPHPGQFTLKTVFRHLARQKRDPITELLRTVDGVM